MTNQANLEVTPLLYSFTEVVASGDRMILVQVKNGRAILEAEPE